MTSSRWPIFSLSLAALLAVAVFTSFGGNAHAQQPSGRCTLFAGTQYPLAVHFLRGELPGPTVMVQGGIQGDEVSGYLAAQILTRAKVKRGNLIVIPRANVPTVLANKRQVNVDLNRRFDQNYNEFYEDRLARAIRFLLQGSDAFIHLHEGSGFYHPTYVDGLRNPGRYGQSIIIDTPLYAGRIDLARVATSVLAKLNHSIVPAWQFKLFNTNTFANDTPHPEQRKSLTYHALSVAGIPALAIEVSKHIKSLGWKASQQLRATALTLEQYGVEITLPEFSEEELERYAKSARTVYINGTPLGPGGNVSVALAPGSRIDATAGPEETLFDAIPGVFASDRPDQNLIGAPRLALSPLSRLDVLADGARVGSVSVAWNNADNTPEHHGKILFACWVNATLRFVPEDGVLDVLEGDQLVLDGVWDPSKAAEEVLNLKGYVSQPGRNDGQDAGQEIILDPGTFIARYLNAEKNDDSVLCRVVRETPGKRRAAFTLRIRPRTIQALRLQGPQGELVVPWKADGTAIIPAGSYRLQDAWSNGPSDKLLVTTGNEVAPWGGIIEIRPGQTLPLTLRQATTFLPMGNMILSTTSD